MHAIQAPCRAQTSAAGVIKKLRAGPRIVALIFDRNPQKDRESWGPGLHPATGDEGIEEIEGDSARILFDPEPGHGEYSSGKSTLSVLGTPHIRRQEGSRRPDRHVHPQEAGEKARCRSIRDLVWNVAQAAPPIEGVDSFQVTEQDSAQVRGTATHAPREMA